MCGRFTIRKEAVDVSGLIESGSDLTWSLDSPRFNAAPGQDFPVLERRNEGERSAFAFQTRLWGMTAPWDRKFERPRMLVNARSETVATRPAFRDSFRQRRCLVPADGYYEWDRSRQPWFFRRKDDGLFFFAAIYNESGFVLLTTVPNDLTARIHDRMPVILGPAAAIRWTGDEPPESAELKELTAPYPADTMESWPVNRLVNSWKHEGPECILPIETGRDNGPEQQELF